jgi:hypothetical protein
MTRFRWTRWRRGWRGCLPVNDRGASVRGDPSGRLLRRRFGEPLASAHEPRIRRLSLEQTEALMEALLDFRTPDDLEAWLATQDAPSA